MPNRRAIARVLIVTVIVAVSGSTRAAGGHGDGPPIVREYKGRLDFLGPFSWLDLDGRRWTERDFRGKVLIVEQWAAWCGPCIAEFPEIQKLSDAVRRDPSIAFVSLDMDQDREAIGEFLKEFRKEYSFPVLFAGAHLKIRSLPHMWIVDREGYIRESFAMGSDLVERALALAEAVKHRLPVSALPSETRQAVRQQNERDGANSR